MRLVLYYIIGLVFGVGISISGMANPAKVLNFFDVAGMWDPSLAFVIGGAVVVTFIGYRFVLKRPQRGVRLCRGAVGRHHLRETDPGGACQAGKCARLTEEH